ncbi:MAG: hypothetical protein IIB69_14495 [Proteobacteria bacterium]|nr:hypothetical protein [Pseudomonadota bacterium]
MARPIRLEFSGALYHITSHGDRQEDIYETNTDRENYLSILNGVCETYNWVCQAYCLKTQWLLAVFDRQKSRAIKRYQQFVSEGIGQPSLWSEIRRQVYLGSEAFLEKMQAFINDGKDLSEVPSSQCRPPPVSLAVYTSAGKNRNTAIYNAYLSGGYTLKEIGDYYGLHYSTVSGIIRNHKSKT